MIVDILKQGHGSWKEDIDLIATQIEEACQQYYKNRQYGTGEMTCSVCHRGSKKRIHPSCNERA